jgi:hypothetical protein
MALYFAVLCRVVFRFHGAASLLVAILLPVSRDEFNSISNEEDVKAFAYKKK